MASMYHQIYYAAEKEAAQSNNTITLATVSELDVPILANEPMILDYLIYYTTAVSTTGLGLSILGPAGPVRVKFAVKTFTTAVAPFFGIGTAYDQVIQATAGLGATPSIAEVRALVVNGANPGLVSLRFKSEVAASAVTIQPSSSVLATTQQVP